MGNLDLPIPVSPPSLVVLSATLLSGAVAAMTRSFNPINWERQARILTQQMKDAYDFGPALNMSCGRGHGSPAS